jgi:hypothetical protein
MFFSRTKTLFVIGMLRIDPVFGGYKKELVFMTRFNDGKTIFGEDNYGIGCQGNVQIHEDWSVAKRYSSVDDAINDWQSFSFEIKNISVLFEITFKGNEKIKMENKGLLKELD